MRVLCVLLFAFVAYPSLGTAQELARVLRVTADNDYFDFWLPPGRRPDDNYTQGARLLWDVTSAPRFMRRLVCSERPACGTSIEVGQEIYTPSIDAPLPVPGERPYAGWLYSRASVRAGDTRGLRSVEITLGVTGRPSLAESAQTAFHRLIPGFRRPLGWSHQLPTEVAIAVRAGKEWYLAPPGSIGRAMDVVPVADATLGTLRTALGVGGRFRLGTGLAHPWLASGAPQRLGIYGFVGSRGEAVARDLFLDGSTFRKSQHVARESTLSEWERGVAISAGRLAVEYRAVTRGREYRSGPPSHSYGALSVQWVYR